MRIVVQGRKPEPLGPKPEPIVTRDQLASAWGVGEQTIRNRIAEGVLPPYDKLMIKYKGWYASTLRAAGVRFVPDEAA
jgi:hypothetical protein